MTGKAKSRVKATPRAKKKRAATPPKPFTLEMLQQCAKRVGAPPLGDTPSAREVVKKIGFLANRHDDLREDWREEGRHATKVKSAFRTLEKAIPRKIEDTETILGAAQAEKRLFGAEAIKRMKSSIAKLKALRISMEEARGQFFSRFENKPGQHFSGLWYEGSAAELYGRLRAAWEENGQKPASAAKTYATIGAGLLKIDIEISDSAIKKAVKSAENQEKSGH